MSKSSTPSLLTTTYTSNALNQYSAISRPDAAEVTGVTSSGVPNLSVNGQPPTGRPPTNGEPGGFSAWVSGDDADPNTLRWPLVDITGTKPGAASDGTDATAVRHGRVFVRPSESPSYDEDGNLISDALWTCTWDAENRLIAMQQREAGAPLAMPILRVEFAYDSQSRRHAKRVLIRPAALAGASARPEKWLLARTTRFWYDGWNLMAETLQSPSSNSELPSASVLRTYTWGTDLSGTMQGAGGVGGLLGISLSTINSQPSTSRSYAACSDANGNVTGLINSSTGNLAARWDYDAFGNQLTDWAGEGISTTELCPLRFSTKYLDAETGWYYYGFRYYSPELGRWLSRDPEGEDESPNLYAMVDNDPVNGADFLGRWEITRKSDKETGTACADAGDTAKSLAAKIGLSAGDASKWMKPYSETFKGGEKVEIPNTVIAFWVGNVHAVGRRFVAWNGSVSHLEKLGFHVDEHTDGGSLSSLLSSASGSGKLHGLYFWGHGYIPQCPDCRANLARSKFRSVKPEDMECTSAACKDKHHRMHSSGLATANHTMALNYGSTGLQYKMALGLMFACWSDDGKPSLFSGAPGGIWHGYSRELNPFTDGPFHVKNWIKAGDQGTKTK